MSYAYTQWTSSWSQRGSIDQSIPEKVVNRTSSVRKHHTFNFSALLLCSGEFECEAFHSPHTWGIYHVTMSSNLHALNVIIHKLMYWRYMMQVPRHRDKDWGWGPHYRHGLWGITFNRFICTIWSFWALRYLKFNSSVILNVCSFEFHHDWTQIVCMNYISSLCSRVLVFNYGIDFFSLFGPILGSWSLSFD